MNSNQRILDIFSTFYQGKRLSLDEMSKEYGASKRTIQRNLTTIKRTLIEHKLNLKLNYDPKQQVYFFENLDRLTPEEVVITSKILLESRAFTNQELDKILGRLLQELSADNYKLTKRFLDNEIINYVPLKHQTQIFELAKEFMAYIHNRTVIQFSYRKNRGEIVQRKGLPVSLFFSEYYFYIILYNPAYESYLSYRLDRFLEIKQTSEKIEIPYKNRLEDGELRKKMHFMYSGKEITFTFRFWGIVDAALDRLSNSKVIKTLEDHSVIIEATAYDNGVIMWLLSQGSYVQVLSPPSFVDKIKKEIQYMYERYHHL